MITLIVTEEGETIEFLVHKEVVYHHCAVVKDAVQTSGSARYQLPDTTPGAVRFLLQWLYSQKITVRQLNGELKVNREGNIDVDDCEEEDFALIEFWVLAGELELPRLQNLALKAIDDVYRKCQSVNTHCVARVYDITTTECILRKYFVALCVKARVSNRDGSEAWSQEIVSDLLDHAYAGLDGEKQRLRVADYYCDIEEL